MAKRRLERILSRMRETFGIERLRPGQDEVIRSVLGGRDTLAIMPTGAGKSLCYQR
jgi:ATP-dependent DNA helicase RecQ